MKSYKNESSSAALVSSRVGGRLKKPKIPFDPSDFTVSKRRQTEPIKNITASSKPTVCCHCQKADNPEELIRCKGECETRIHLTCLQSTSKPFGKDEELTWKCSSCQTCKMCNKYDIDGEHTILKCYICFSSYHVKCHGLEETIEILKGNRFGCRFCFSDKIQKLSSANDPNSSLSIKPRALPRMRPKPVNSNNKLPPANDATTSLLRKPRVFARTSPTPVSSETKLSDDGFLGFEPEGNEQTMRHCADLHRPSTSTEIRSSGSSESHYFNDDADIPDATKWSTEQVFKYFQSKFPQYAHVFKDQEIDGPSLYLLKRTDVVKGFNIKFGPAVKIYGHILALQTKCSDPTLSWQ